MTDLDDIHVRASARIVTGVTTNRVQMRRPPRRPKPPRVRKRDLPSPPKPPKPPRVKAMPPVKQPRVAKQPTPRKRPAFDGMRVKLVCFSVHPNELALFDVAATALGMNRSSFLRAGAHALIAAHAALKSQPP